MLQFKMMQRNCGKAPTFFFYRNIALNDFRDRADPVLIAEIIYREISKAISSGYLGLNVCVLPIRGYRAREIDEVYTSGERARVSFLESRHRCVEARGAASPKYVTCSSLYF
jgi:hypothetical protein